MASLVATEQDEKGLGEAVNVVFLYCSSTLTF